MSKYFIVKDQLSKGHIMTARSIRRKIKRAVKKNKNNYEWIASPKELLFICNNQDFPEKYALEIKAGIVSSYSNSIFVANNPEDAYNYSAVYEAYNSLYGIEDERIIEIRYNFLEAFLRQIQILSYQFLYHKSEEYSKICVEWKKRRLKELFPKSNLDFPSLTKSLLDDFNETILRAKEIGYIKKTNPNEKEERIKQIQEAVKGFYSLYGFTDDKPIVPVRKF